jgi:hypothetical protein
MKRFVWFPVLKMENGKWKMANGKWEIRKTIYQFPLENFKWRIPHESHMQGIQKSFKAGFPFSDRLLRSGKLDKPGAVVCFGNGAQHAEMRLGAAGLLHHSHRARVSPAHVDNGQGNAVDRFI